METSPFSDYELISHPHQSLREHLAGCDAISSAALSQKFIGHDFYPREKLETWRHLLVYFHDFGKGTDYFQHRIIEATEREKVAGFWETQQAYIAHFKALRDQDIAEALYQDSRLGSHAKLGAYFVLMCLEHDDPLERIILMKVIRHHHGHLGNFLESSAKEGSQQYIYLDSEASQLLEAQLRRLNFELYNKILSSVGYAPAASTQWPALRDTFTSIRRATRLQDDLRQRNTYKYFFLQHYLFSLLLSADKGDMQLPRHSERRETWICPNVIFEETCPALVEQYKTYAFASSTPKPIDAQREEAFQEVAANARTYAKHGFFSLTLPTGMGKTFAAFKAAFELQRHMFEATGTRPRIVYCLPFTSVIDQNAAILEEIFRHNGLPTDLIGVHHYLAGFKAGYERENEGSEPIDFPASEYLTEGWEHDVVVTTFVQFLESIFTNRNRALRKFHNLAHAIIVLDEVQAISPIYFRVVETAFQEMHRYFGTKFMFVTATQPYLFEHRKDVVELTDFTREKTRRYFEQMERIDLDQSWLRRNGYEKMDEDEIEEAIWQAMEHEPEKSVLVICNTIKQSQELFKNLRKRLKNAEVPVRYLSASLVPYTRKKLIQQIKECKTRQILVSTQVVEAGVDIDFDLVFRDWAPLDSINQSAGRCNRNAVRGRGRVVLFHSGKAHYIYPVLLLEATKMVLRSPEFGDLIPESRFLQLNEQYALAVRRKVVDNSDCSTKLQEAMRHLQLETIQENFKVIENGIPAYDVFIPLNEEAKAAWQELRNRFAIENRFERKAEIKKLRPKFMPFVTRFPQDRFEPPRDQKDKVLMYLENWETWYDEITGFKGLRDNEHY